jgi:hypothetical protein
VSLTTGTIGIGKALHDHLDGHDADDGAGKAARWCCSADAEKKIAIIFRRLHLSPSHPAGIDSAQKAMNPRSHRAISSP